MFEALLSESERLNDELSDLRQAIIHVEPFVLLDGRFEKMITTPIAIIAIARELILQLPSPQERFALDEGRPMGDFTS